MSDVTSSAAALYAEALVEQSRYEQRMADLCKATPITDHDPPGLIKQFNDPTRECVAAVQFGVTPDYRTAYFRLTDGTVRTYQLDGGVWRPT